MLCFVIFNGCDKMVDDIFDIKGMFFVLGN